MPAGAVPVKLTPRYFVTPSPTVPESLYDDIAGFEGAGGGTVSTVNVNGTGVSALPAFGCVSVPVTVWVPSESATVVRAQTLAEPSDEKLPILVPSTKTSYFDSPPSPMM